MDNQFVSGKAEIIAIYFAISVIKENLTLFPKITNRRSLSMYTPWVDLPGLPMATSTSPQDAEVLVSLEFH